MSLTTADVCIVDSPGCGGDYLRVHPLVYLALDTVGATAGVGRAPGRHRGAAHRPRVRPRRRARRRPVPAVLAEARGHGVCAGDRCHRHGWRRRRLRRAAHRVAQAPVTAVAGQRSAAAVTGRSLPVGAPRAVVFAAAGGVSRRGAAAPCRVIRQHQLRAAVVSEPGG